MIPRHAVGLAALMLLLVGGSAQAQYYGAGSAGGPQPSPGGFYGRPGNLRFGAGAPSGGHHRHGHGFNGGGFNPGYNFNYPYANGYWGSNPYLNSYYGFGYASPGFYGSYYPPDYYATPPAASYAPPPPVKDDARLPPPNRLPAPEPNVANIDLHVPAAATVWAQGVQMPATGTLRRFITPPLEPGSSYSYEFRIVYPENGKDVSLVRHVSVAAGDRKSLIIIDTTASK